MTGGKWQKVRQEHSIKQTLTEPHSPWQNRAEGAIRELKRHVRRLMKRQRAPSCLWDFCAVYVAEIRSLTANPLFSLHGRTPYELVTGSTPDISEYVDFEWYQPVWYLDTGSFPQEKLLLGCWLGVAHRIGQAMCYWILPQSGKPIARTTIKGLSADELATDAVKKQLKSMMNISPRSSLRIWKSKEAFHPLPCRMSTMTMMTLLQSMNCTYGP